MTRHAAWLCFALASCLPDMAVAEIPPSILGGVLIHASPEPVPIATEITIDDRPITAFWDEYFAKLFSILDRNADGALDSVEAARIPAPACLQAEFRGDFDNVTADFAPQAQVDRSPADASISPAELAQYLSRAGVGSGELRVAPTTRGLDLVSARRLFDMLASPRSNWIESSFADAYARLRRFDLNDDERLTFTELRMATDASKLRAYRGAEQGPLFAPRTGTEAILRPAKLAIRFGSSPRAAGEFDIANSHAPGGQSWPTIVVDKSTAALTCHAGAAQLALRTVPGYGSQDFDSARQWLLQQFEADDLDRNQVLDQHEVRRSASSSYFSYLTAVADVNSDSLLSTPEMERYLALQASAAKHCVILTACDVGSALATILDEDGDGALSLRELRHGWSRVVARDRNSDRELSWAELPHDYQLTWSIGRPHSDTKAAVAPNGEFAGPRWFLLMDRNGDGDLSRREFLGTLAAFGQYDTDADGLISPTEAGRPTKN